MTFHIKVHPTVGGGQALQKHEKKKQKKKNPNDPCLLPACPECAYMTLRVVRS